MEGNQDEDGASDEGRGERHLISLLSFSLPPSLSLSISMYRLSHLIWNSHSNSYSNCSRHCSDPYWEKERKLCNPLRDILFVSCFSLGVLLFGVSGLNV